MYASNDRRFRDATVTQVRDPSSSGLVRIWSAHRDGAALLRREDAGCARRIPGCCWNRGERNRVV